MGSGGIIGGIIGGVIGFFIGGPPGALIGFSIGYAAGTMIDGPDSDTGDMGPLASYPIQRSNKATPITKVYGSKEVAGNILWMSEFNPRNGRQSFLIGLVEGPANVLRAWKGKDEISLDDFLQFPGNGSIDTGINALTGEEFSNYPNTLCVFFEDYETKGSLPNFTFEVQSDLFTLLVGRYVSGGAVMSMSKFGPDGEYDTDWGASGHWDADGGTGGDNCGAIVQTPDGGYLVGHHGSSVRLTDRYFFRFTTSVGTLEAGDAVNNGVGDTAVIHHIDYWGGGGVGYYDTLVGDSFVDGQTISNGADTVLMAGTPDEANQHRANITKLDSAGQIDTTWGFNGAVTVTIHTVLPSAIILDSDENIYVTFSDGYVAILKMDSDGNILWAKGNGGTVDYPSDGYTLVLSKKRIIYDPLLGLPIDIHEAESRILYGGRIDQNPPDSNLVMCILASDGTIDQTWGSAGYYKGAVFVNSLVGIRQFGTGYLLQTRRAGGGGDAGAVRMLTVDGDLDTDWGSNGFAALGYSSFVSGEFTNNTMDVTKRHAVVICHIDGGSTITPPTYLVRIDIDGNDTLLRTWNVAPNQLNSVKLIGGSIIVGSGWTDIDDDGERSTLRYYDWLGNLRLVYNNDGLNHAISVIFKYGSGTDVNGAMIVKDILTNARYGAGINESLFLNTDKFNDAISYCDANGLFFSFTINTQKPVVDWAKHIAEHFQGFIHMAGDYQITLSIYKSETSLATITRDDLFIEDKEDTEPPVRVYKRPSSEIMNRVELSYDNRSNRYDKSVAFAMDEVDQRVSGKVKKRTIQFLGITNAILAQKTAYRLLYESLYRFGTYELKLSYRNMLLEVGDVLTLDDGFLISNQKIRLISIEEDVNGRALAIKAVDDPDYLYEDFAFEIQETERTFTTTPTLIDSSVTFTEDLNTPKLSLHIVPGGEDTSGWNIYRSYDGVSYDLIGVATIEDIANGGANSLGTTTSSLSAHKTGPVYAGGEVIEVSIGTITDLDTAITDTLFFGNKRLAKIGNEIIAYKTCVETSVTGIWQITGLIRGLFGTEAVAHTSGEVFSTMEVDFSFLYEDADIGSVLYFKIITAYGDAIQSLSDVTAIQYTVLGNYKRPMPVSLMRIQNREGLLTYETDDVAIAFYLSSKTAGFNIGGHGNILWNAYEVDPSIQTLDVTLKQTDDTEILNEVFDISEISEPMAVEILDADRGGNSEYIVEMNPGAMYSEIGRREIQVEQV